MEVNVLRQLKTCNRKAVLIPDIYIHAGDIKPGTSGKETFKIAREAGWKTYHPEPHLSSGRGHVWQQPQVPVDRAGGDGVLKIVLTTPSSFKAGFPEEQQASQQEKLTLDRFSCRHAINL